MKWLNTDSLQRITETSVEGSLRLAGYGLASSEDCSLNL